MLQCCMWKLYAFVVFKYFQISHFDSIFVRSQSLRLLCTVCSHNIVHIRVMVHITVKWCSLEQSVSTKIKIIWQPSSLSFSDDLVISSYWLHKHHLLLWQWLQGSNPTTLCWLACSPANTSHSCSLLICCCYGYKVLVALKFAYLRGYCTQSHYFYLSWDSQQR